jgi:hypothetical protein
VFLNFENEIIKINIASPSTIDNKGLQDQPSEQKLGWFHVLKKVLDKYFDDPTPGFMISFDYKKASILSSENQHSVGEIYTVSNQLHHTSFLQLVQLNQRSLAIVIQEQMDEFD